MTSPSAVTESEESVESALSPQSGLSGEQKIIRADIGGNMWPGQTWSRAFINQRLDYRKNFGLPDELIRSHAMLLAGPTHRVSQQLKYVQLQLKFMEVFWCKNLQNN